MPKLTQATLKFARKGSKTTYFTILLRGGDDEKLGCDPCQALALVDDYFGVELICTDETKCAHVALADVVKGIGNSGSNGGISLYDYDYERSSYDSRLAACSVNVEEFATETLPVILKEYDLINVIGASKILAALIHKSAFKQENYASCEYPGCNLSDKYVSRCAKFNNEYRCWKHCY